MLSHGAWVADGTFHRGSGSLLLLHLLLQLLLALLLLLCLPLLAPLALLLRFCPPRLLHLLHWLGVFLHVSPLLPALLLLWQASLIFLAWAA